MKRIPWFLSIFLFGLWLASCGGEQALTVQEAWARPAGAGENSAIYFQIENSTSEPDALLSVDTAVAGAVEIHQSRMDENGVMTMEQQSQVVIPDRSEVEFAPGGLHVMLIGLLEPLEVGDEFQVDLVFENGGTRTVDVIVREP